MEIQADDEMLYVCPSCSDQLIKEYNPSFLVQFGYSVRWHWTLLAWELKDLNGRCNPYAHIRGLKERNEFLEYLLAHSSCVCGRSLGHPGADRVLCEHCLRLATIDSPSHNCSVYVSTGVYWCKPCVVQVARQLGLAAEDESEDDIVEVVEMLPDGDFLERYKAWKKQGIVLQSELIGEYRWEPRTGVTYYTIDDATDKQGKGYPVRFLLPGRKMPLWYPGPFSGEGEALREFQAMYAAKYPDGSCEYVAPSTFDELAAVKLQGGAA
jgi:hypothetical protein